MKWTVFVKPNAKKAKVLQTQPNELTISVNAPPTDGKANERLIEILSEHFKIPKSRIKIVHGQNSRKKSIEI